MTTDENILMEMLERVTNPDKENVDNLAVQMFCMIVQSNTDLVTKAHQLIVKKMHSNNTAEAIRAIALLEECMSKAGSEFQKKTAKFSFLNELIALVLDKHPGPPASVETKKRIMECLMLWTVEHQDKSKIQETYDNLKKQVNFEQDSSVINTTSANLTNSAKHRSSILGNDDQLLAKLVKQGGPENLKKANLLIKHRVNQEARRIEFIFHLKAELKKIESTMEVLDEMLKSYSPEAIDADNRDIILQLYNNCKGYNVQMARWPDFLRDAEPPFLEEVLTTKELLMVVIQRYKETFENEKQCSISTNVNTSPANNDIVSELLSDTLTISNQETDPIKPKSSTNANNTLDELNEIFGSFNDNVELNNQRQSSDLFCNLDVLEPINLFETATEDKPATSNLSLVMTNEGKEEKSQKYKKLQEIDKMSEELFKQNLKEEQRLLSFKKITGKLTLNDMAKEKKEGSLLAAAERKSEIITKEEKKLCNLPSSDFKDLEKNKEELHKKAEILEKELNLANDLRDSNSCKSPKLVTSKPLAEISVDLDDVTPLDEGHRLLLDDDDIQVSLYFTADRPSEHVSIIVMTVTNKSKLHIKDFQFEASVKKPCKVRLLPPTDVSMLPRKPFRPSAPINQVVLLLNPTQKPVDITCIIGYKLGDDPDPIKESIITKDIPYV